MNEHDVLKKNHNFYIGVGGTVLEGLLSGSLFMLLYSVMQFLWSSQFDMNRVLALTGIDNRYQERAVANGSLMMCEVQGAKEDFIRRWNTIFKEYPDVFEDSDCRKIIYDLTEDAVQYLLKIKEKTL